jgi:hypothetical protein
MYSLLNDWVLLRPTTNYSDLFSTACTYVGFLTLLIGRFQGDFDRSVSLHLALKHTIGFGHH